VLTQRGKGIQVLRGAGRKGDMHTRIQVAVPKTLSFAQQEIFDKLRTEFPALASVGTGGADEGGKHRFFKKKK
jgi:DnaJ-class molecular chaperone